jgi:glycolate oxidase FAD binding subunit
MTHEPATIDEAASLLKESAREHTSIALAGGMTEWALHGDGHGADARISTLRLADLVEYAPADQVVTVQGGMTLGELQRQLRSHAQRLALDPPLASRATIGGIAASNAYGPRRMRYGTIKDLMLGMTIVRADGTIARGGGKVVKNVAGFDVPKLMIGSFGTLAMIASVTLRVHPAPEAERRLFLSGCTADMLRQITRDMLDAQLESAYLFAVLRQAQDDIGAYTACVGFEGFAPGVDAQLRVLGEIATRRGVTAFEGSDADAAALDEVHETTRTRGALRAKIAAPFSQLAVLHDRAVLPLVATLRDARCILYPPSGVAFVSGEPDDIERIALVVREARTFAEAQQGSLVLTAAPAKMLERVDVWGAPPPSFGLMRALKDRFDPEHRLNPGRFVGGL